MMISLQRCSRLRQTYLHSPVEIIVTKLYSSGSQSFLLRGTLQQYQYLAAPLDAKRGVKVNKIDNWWHP